MSSPRVVVLVKPGCHLCDDAVTVVAGVCDPAGVEWSTRDLGEVDEATRTQWADYVPVITVDGEVHDLFRVSPDRLRQALTG